MLSILEAGLANKFADDYLIMGKGCGTDKASNKATSLSIVTLQGPFIILAMGAVAGMIALFAEMMAHRVGQRTRVRPVTLIQVQGVSTEVTRTCGTGSRGPTE